MILVDLEAKSRARRARLEEEIHRIVESCRRAGYAKAILFGSMARGDVGPDSDIDLLLVKDTPDRFADRLDEFCRTVAPRVAATSQPQRSTAPSSSSTTPSSTAR